MALLDFMKKLRNEPCCCCGGDFSDGNACCEDGCCSDDDDCCESDDACCADGSSCCETDETEKSSVQVLGGGCKNCHTLEANTKEALQSLGMDTKVELVTDPAAIAAYGVMSTPALVVDGKVLSTGRVLTAAQAAEAIKAARA